MEYKLPKKLFEGEYINLNIAAKVVYGVILEKIEKEPRYDDKGKYCTCPQTEIVGKIGCCMHSIKTYLKQLREYGLLEMTRAKQNEPNRLYLKEL